VCTFVIRLRKDSFVTDHKALRTAGMLAVTAPILLNVGFTLLGSSFNYPDVLDEPAARTLREFHDDATTISLQFGLLALSAALLAPLAIYLGRALGRSGIVRASVYVGIGAAVVQFIGLMRWPILVPGLADTATDATNSVAERADAVDTFETLGDVLGSAIGETLGYALTAAWTVLIIKALSERQLVGRVLTVLGMGAAVLIALGVLVPLDAPGADVAVFLGYILWSVFLIALGVILLRAGRTPADRPVATAATTPGVAPLHP
jgi:hypothetical protein